MRSYEEEQGQKGEAGNDCVKLLSCDLSNMWFNAGLNQEEEELRQRPFADVANTLCIIAQRLARLTLTKMKIFTFSMISLTFSTQPCLDLANWKRNKKANATCDKAQIANDSAVLDFEP